MAKAPTKSKKKLEFTDEETEADSRSTSEDEINQNNPDAAQEVTEKFDSLRIEVLHGGHVVRQEQYNIIHSNAKHFHCSWHATWQPFKNPQSDEEQDSELEESDEEQDSELEESDEKQDGELVESDEKQDGEWLSSHPWDSKKPDPALKIKKIVANSASYPTSPEWTKKNGVDLAKIYFNLPKFVETEMKGTINSCREELKQRVKGRRIQDSPHVLEIKDAQGKGNFPKDAKVLRDERFMASSLTSPPKSRMIENCFYFYCEFTLKMYVPSPMLSWFETRKYDEIQCIQKIKWKNFKEKRWIFIPSFRRAQIALLNWPEDDLMNTESTIRILVVRPSEFREYARHCGHTFPVISLPQDEIGAGYARYWTQKIALRLDLHFIWMIDDSLECFYEHHPGKKPPQNSYSKYRRRQFGLVFERIENFVKEEDDSDHPIAAMSPRRFNARFPVKQAFVCKPPQCAVYLNIRKLQEKNIYYRPELKTLEDMIFGYECEMKGLKVFVDNRVHLQDHDWKNTGASSPSIQKRP